MVAKWLVLADVSVLQILAVRSWLILTMILLLTGMRGQWQDIPSLRVWTGAFVIVASGIYVIHRESLRRTTE